MYKHLKDLRESLGMTQEEFGKSVGVAKTTYNNYEIGARKPKSDFWIAVAMKYGVTIDYLMGYSDDPHGTIENKKTPGTAEAAPGDELLDEAMRLWGLLRPDQKVAIVSLLRTMSAEA